MGDMAAHLLVVEDDPLTLEVLTDLLRDAGYDVATAGDGVEAVAEAEREPPDLVISDVTMPRADGFELVRRLRARPASATVPILLVSAATNANRRAAGLDLGADDFIAKPIDPRELLARIRAQLRRATERTELQRRSVVDPLTGALNRRGIDAVLKRMEEHARRTGSTLSVLMIDVDHFKAINDQFGHPAGDAVLRHVARALVDAVRVADHVGRFGGDEFIVLLPDGTAAEAAALARRLGSLEVPTISVDSKQLTITISIGAATLRPDDTVGSLLERADREMYQVKHRGEPH